MKKYLSGSWAVMKNYLFGMIFFFIFIIGFYKWVSIYSIAIFIIMIPLLYFELTHYEGVEKRRDGNVKPYQGAIYGLLAILPFVLLQIIISQLDIKGIFTSFNMKAADSINYSMLKQSLIKGFVAPMLFIARQGGYTVWSYALAWSTIVLTSFLGYFSGYKGFDLSEFIRKALGLQPRKKGTTNNKTSKGYRR